MKRRKWGRKWKKWVGESGQLKLKVELLLMNRITIFFFIIKVLNLGFNELLFLNKVRLVEGKKSQEI